MSKPQTNQMEGKFSKIIGLNSLKSQQSEKTKEKLLQMKGDKEV